MSQTHAENGGFDLDNFAVHSMKFCDANQRTMSKAWVGLQLELKLEIYISAPITFFKKYNFICHVLNTRCS